MAYELIDFADIYTAAMEELKLQSSDTVNLNRLKRMINTIYIQEVLPAARWYWLQGNTVVTHKNYYGSGTANVTPNSNSVTISVAPASTDGDSGSFLGWNFSVEGKNEVYKVTAHTALATTLTLDKPFNTELNTAIGYKLWNDLIALPTDLRETIECWHDHMRSPMEGKGTQEIRRIEASNPKAEGRPVYYSTYNYTSGDESTRYRQLRVYPAISSYKTLIKLDYIKEATSLDSAGDEPLMPVEDRIVLFYGALSLAWGSIGRNPEEAARCRALFEAKLARMMGKIQDSIDKPRIEPDSIYIRSKKGPRIFGRKSSTAVGGGASSYTAPSYLENVTINGATLTGNMTVNSGITVDGRDLSADAIANDAHIAATSNVHGIGATASVVGTDTAQTLTNKTIVATSNTITAIADANIDAAAAIAFSKLATLTSGNILVGSAGNVATSVAMSGDATIIASGALTIANDAVTNAKLAEMATLTIKGNATGGTANPTDLSATETTAILNVMVGDSGSGGTKGLVPAPAAGDAAADKFLKADGTWTTPAISGDVVGPASSTDNGFVKFDGTTGKLIKDSAATISNADVNASAAIDFSKLATLTSANILVGSAGNVATSVAVTGDISLTNGGVTAYAGTVPLNKGGTGQTTKAPAFDALSPMTTGGDLIYGGASGTGTRLANGTAGQFLQSSGTTAAPVWATRVSFSANTSTTAATTSSPFVYTVEDHDTDGAYDATTGVFTCPTGKGGVYAFSAVMFVGVSATFVALHKNGTKVSQGTATVSSVEVAVLPTTLITLAAGDTVDIRPGANATASGGATLNIFCGFKI